MSPLWRGTARALAWLVPLGVLVQAFAAAPNLLFLRGRMDLHGSLSFLVLGFALGVAIFAWALQLGWGTLALAGSSVVLLAVQTYLGYAARGPRIADHEPVSVEGGLAVVHVSLGMFLLVFTLGVAFKLTRALHVQQLAEEWAEGLLDDA